MAEGLKVDIEVKGLEELQKKLEKEAFLGDGVKHLMGKAALTVERQVKIFSPVDTGRLRASWTPIVSAEPVPLWAKVSTNVKYAAPLEVSGKSPRGVGRIPFLKPAYEAVKSKIDSLLKEAGVIIEARFNK